MLDSAQKKTIGYAVIFLAGIVSVPAVQANRLETFLLDKSRNRIEFTTENEVEPRGQIITNPTRVVIDLPGATYTGPTVRRDVGSVVQSLRVGRLDPLTTRLVIEFAPDFNADLLDQQPLKMEAKSPSRWSIQFPTAIATAIQNTVNSFFIMPTAGEITSPFGWRIHPITGLKTLHKGIDIGAPMGAPILAAADGVVNDVGWDDGGYGNFVELRHPDGTLTLYGHANRILVTKGQEVKQGQIIGEVGSTGRSTGPHLHFEVQVNKIAVDPNPYLRSDFVIVNLASR
ncbi:metalloendopeptidase-like membrane protein [Synechococcus sp. PCC 7502]|uniref:M23 family metallopeptidase n=1 Tax=Synechococcus sp. PCC 7502 TaxID=1173263 RepID=UPI00029F82F2|nr:M23 family metallopeptidase [Synechococcus sp. PCC 7502]AFY74487.1 metalloendopeptidase-like membrane protein [Synechococcus sp. PCC 7502]